MFIDNLDSKAILKCLKDFVGLSRLAIFLVLFSYRIMKIERERERERERDEFQNRLPVKE